VASGVEAAADETIEGLRQRLGNALAERDEALAREAALAAENARLHAEQREVASHQAATVEILQLISASPTDTSPVLDAVANAALRLGNASDVVVALRDGANWVTVSHAGLLGGPAGGRFRLDRDTAPGRAILEGKIVHLPDIRALDAAAFAAAHWLPRDRGYRAALSVPMMRKGTALGSITLRKQTAGPFTSHQIALVETLAAQEVIALDNARLLDQVQKLARQAVIAVENAQLLVELRRRTTEALERQTAMADILRVIAGSPDDMQPVFEAIAQRSNQLVGGRSTVVLRLIDETLSLVSFTPISREADESLKSHFPAPLAGFLWAQSLRQGEIVRIADAEVDFAEQAGFLDTARSRGWRAALAVPLLREKTLIGVVAVTRAEPGPFADEHIRLLKTFADQAVIAISNVELFRKVQQRTRELSASLEELRTAQDRLIRTERLASLGQLTAGIAHEIKNPLNFVNNFASLSVELLVELKEATAPALDALGDGRREEVDEVIGLLSDNLAKIVEHGKRADGIIRGMLEHSRASTGERRMVEINGLVEAALGLAYHGARARDPSFNIRLDRDLGNGIEPIELVPQDVTRVFLNLFGNGFYAAAKRAREAGAGAVQPVLTVATRAHGNDVEVRVRDNGTGIPPEVRERLFQPFFTTKPTGEGTGLGLSISYDIVTQQHGGTIEVESTPGSFTEFTVRLPRRRPTAASGRG
jgi:two-component system NtrC family sensor kinase